MAHDVDIISVPASTAAVVRFHVRHDELPYERLPEAYADIEEQAERIGRPVAWDRAMWEEYWSEPGTPEDQTRTEVFWPVTPPG